MPDWSAALRPAALWLIVLLLAGCSHRTPWLRSDVNVRPAPAGVSDTLVFRLLLVGDAGEAGAAVLADVARLAALAPSSTLVAYLGDNMYPEGMTPARADEAAVRLLPQIEAARAAGARAVFVPGNHDWADGGDEGYAAILEQGRYVGAELGDEGFLPRDGCPGPVRVPFGGDTGIRVIALDTQWWLHEGPRPADHCPQETPGEVLGALGELLETPGHAVVIAHHPLLGYGRHSGFSEWREHVRIPVVGSLVALVRKLAPRSQDYGSRVYRAMTESFRSVLASGPRDRGLRIWAAGHEHSLQVLEGGVVDYVLVSGAGAKATPVTDGEETLFAHSHRGFMVLDFLESGRAVLEVVEPGAGAVFRMDLGTGPPL